MRVTSIRPLRSSGSRTVAALAILVVTGYGLYYVAGEGDRPLWSLVHWIAGFVTALLFVAHVLTGRRSVRP